MVIQILMGSEFLVANYLCQVILVEVNNPGTNMHSISDGGQLLCYLLGVSSKLGIG